MTTRLPPSESLRVRSSAATSDAPYLSGLPDHYDTPKEYFKIIAAAVRARHGEAPISLIDIGCAAGAFLHYALSVLPVRQSAGVDNSGHLLKQARVRLPATELIHASVASPLPLDGRAFDVVTCLGVLSLFDEFDPILDRVWSLVRPGGTLYLFDLCNDEPVDVLMRFREHGPAGPGDWLSGFNVRSRVTYDAAIEKLRPAATPRWHALEMPFAVSKTSPLRAWTMATERRPHQLVVGTGQLLDCVIIELEKSAT